VIARIPETETGYEYSALASYRTQLILVGGRSKVNSWDVPILFFLFLHRLRQHIYVKMKPIVYLVKIQGCVQLENSNTKTKIQTKNCYGK
jgi:hypothetical protein